MHSIPPDARNPLWMLHRLAEPKCLDEIIEGARRLIDSLNIPRFSVMDFCSGVSCGGLLVRSCQKVPLGLFDQGMSEVSRRGVYLGLNSCNLSLFLKIECYESQCWYCRSLLIVVGSKLLILILLAISYNYAARNAK